MATIISTQAIAEELSWFFLRANDENTILLKCYAFFTMFQNKKQITIQKFLK